MFLILDIIFSCWISFFLPSEMNKIFFAAQGKVIDTYFIFLYLNLY